jgi:hypothetical protein
MFSKTIRSTTLICVFLLLTILASCGGQKPFSTGQLHPRDTSGGDEGSDLVLPHAATAPTNSAQWIGAPQVAAILSSACGFPLSLTPALDELKTYYLQGQFAHHISANGTLDQRRALSYYMFGHYGYIEKTSFVVKFDKSVTGTSLPLATAIAQTHNLTIQDSMTLADNDFYVYRVAPGFGQTVGGGTVGGGSGGPVPSLRAQLASMADQILIANSSVDLVEPVVNLDPGSAPNDPRVSMQPNEAWQVPKVSAPEVWDLTKGEGIYTAVFDTGVYISSGGTFHEDLQGRIELPDRANGSYLFNPPAEDPQFLGKTDIGVRDIPRDIDYTNEPLDYNSHGTSVAGVIAANDNNNKGIAGIAPDSMVVPFKVFYYDPDANSRHGKSIWIGQAAKEVLKIKEEQGLNIRIANWSLYGYGPQYDEEEDDPLDGWWDGDVTILEASAIHLQKGGVFVVGINGNIGTGDEDNWDYPGIYESVVAVAPLTYHDKLPTFGRLTDFTDIYGPGDEMEAPTALSNSSYTDDFSGGSAAAPVVSGVYALHLAAFSERTGSSALPAARSASFTLPELLVLMQNFAIVLGNARPISADLPNTSDTLKLPGRVDAGYMCGWRAAFAAGAKSASFVAYQTDDSPGGTKLFVLNPLLDGGGAQIGHDPVVGVYDGAAWAQEIVPGPSVTEPAETLVGLDTYEVSSGQVELFALVARRDTSNPQTVHFYESQRTTNGSWNSAALVGSITDHISGPLPIGVDFEKSENGSYAIATVAYQVGGYNQRIIPLNGASLPSFAGEPRQVECAAGDNEVLLGTDNGSGSKQLWRKNTGNWIQVGFADGFNGSEELLSLGVQGPKDSGSTGWAVWDGSFGVNGQVRFRFYRRGFVQSSGNFSTTAVLTNGTGGTPALPQRIDLLGNSDNKPYVALYSEGNYGSTAYKYHLIEGYRYNWSGVPALEGMWHRRFSAATTTGNIKDLYNWSVDPVSNSAYLVYVSPKDIQDPVHRLDVKTLNFDD